MRCKGFTLTEVLMAIFILGIGVLGIAALFPAGIARCHRAARGRQRDCPAAGPPGAGGLRNVRGVH
ncbi:MAG: type IV pilus modification PilV family protein [Planctomycetota bacterium]